MTIEEIAGGPLPTNCYLLTDDETKKRRSLIPDFGIRNLQMQFAGKMWS